MVNLLWIGALKFEDYEVENIEPLVTSSPLFSRLSAAGQFVVKDLVLLGASLLTAAESLRAAADHPR